MRACASGSPRDRRAWAPLLALLLCAGAFFPATSAHAGEAQPFGVSDFTMQTTCAENVVRTGSDAARVEKPACDFTQAGGHPWALTTTWRFTTEDIPSPGGGTAIVPTRDPKDIVTVLPAGLYGVPNPEYFPQCPIKTVIAQGECGSDTQLGTARLRWLGGKQELSSIVNVVPEKGQSAEFGLNSGSVTTFLTAHLVRSGSTYSIVVESNDIPSSIELSEVEITFWGVPGSPEHNAMRGEECIGETEINGKVAAANEFNTCGGGGHEGTGRQVAFLTLPTDCAAGPEDAISRVDTWEEPGVYTVTPAPLQGVDGCDLLQFEPAIGVQTNTPLADEPVQLGVTLTVPLTSGAEALATPEVRNSVVTLPEGLSVSPGIVDGIEACEESGPDGINFSGPESEETALDGEPQLAPGHCPDASTIGEAEAQTPFLTTPVKGHVYLARPGCGGQGQAACTDEDALDGNLYQLYLELGGSGPLAADGINIKARGKVEVDPATGQLTTVFEDTPPLPFSELRILLNGGPRAALDNPAVCGSAVTTTDFTPWSAPGVTPAPESLFMAGTADATPESHYEVEGCADPTPFAPGFVAGTVTPNAGQFSSFTMNVSRQDREQFVKGIQVDTPPGLLGMLASVPLCGEPAADAGSCPESSKIGTARVASGAGSHPFEIEGNVYLTGPYGGAPFGLSVVTDAVAGPFNLGLVVVRAKIAVNPETSALTVTTDETGPYAIPQIVFGVPLRLQRVTVDIDRPDFMFNPTSCGAKRLTATISGSEDATATVASPFAVGGCRSLAFKPTFQVSTSGRTSRADGASLDVKLSYPAGSAGEQANIAKVKVDLPKQLPSRLTTLQKACLAQTFAANPAGCPPASVVGSVRASTPLLPVGLSGPVYFVSHGGEAFPSLIVVLQGDGVRVDLTGSTFIDKAGITSSTFKTVPDVPVNTFELYLPEGRYSALAANGSLCAAAGKLVMPTEFDAQNGAVLKQSTKIAVTGCAAGAAAAKRRTSR